MTHFDDDPADPRTAELLRTLPREVAPARDLWPGISSRLGARQRQRASRWAILGVGLAAAAALVLLLRPPARVTTDEAVESAQVRLILNATTGSRSATARSLARYVGILDGAIAETEAALRETPGDPALRDFLTTLQRRRLELLAQAARFAAES